MTGTFRGVWVAIGAALALLGGCVMSPGEQARPTGAMSGPPPSGASASPSIAADPGPDPDPDPGPDPDPPASVGVMLGILPIGSSQQAISVGGQIRMYRAYRPARLTRFAPLVVMFHGGLGSAALAERAYGWDALADREGFVVLYPDAIGAAWNVGGGCCGLAPAHGVDDVAFVKAAIDNLSTRVSIDPSRMYAAGMSAGGMMAYRMACETTLFAAIGPVAATQAGDCPNPAPTSILHVHGTADDTVPYLGAVGSGIAQIDGVAIPVLHAAWRGYGRCGGDVVATAGGVTTTTAQCPEGRTVELVTIEGGGHAWPGTTRSGPLDASPSPGPDVPSRSPAAAPAAGPIVGPTVGPTTAPTGSATPGGSTVATAASTAYDTTVSLWAFFKAHGR